LWINQSISHHFPNTQLPIILCSIQCIHNIYTWSQRTVKTNFLINSFLLRHKYDILFKGDFPVVVSLWRERQFLASTPDKRRNAVNFSKSGNSSSQCANLFTPWCPNNACYAYLRNVYLTSNKTLTKWAKYFSCKNEQKLSASIEGLTFRTWKPSICFLIVSIFDTNAYDIWNYLFSHSLCIIYKYYQNNHSDILFSHSTV